MGFDKVKINTTPLLLLLLEGWLIWLCLRLHYTHTHTHTSRQIPHQPSFSFSPRHLRCRLPSASLPRTPPPPAPLPLSRCLCPRHKHPYIPPPSLFSLLLQRLCLLQWTFMTTHSVRVLFSLPLPLFLLHSPQVKY